MTPSEQLAALLERLESQEAKRVRWNRRTWPGRKAWRPRSAPEPAERVRHRLVLYLVSFRMLGTLPEAFGLGASLLAIGGVVLDAWLIYDDSLNRAGLRALRGWASRPTNFVETTSGRRKWQLIALSTFNREVLARHGYRGKATVVGADLGRTLGLHADWWRRAERRSWDGGWSVGLRGWGVTGRKDPSRWVRSTGLPLLYLQGASAYGLRAGFGKPRESFEGETRGQWTTLPSGKKAPYPGRFADIVPGSHGLGGVDTDDLDDHLTAWGLPAIGAPFALSPNVRGAAVATTAVVAIHRLALLLDDEAARWAGGLDLRRLYSPGTVAEALLAGMGLVPPLAKFPLTDDEYDAWTVGLHGGWVVALLCGVPFPAIDIDVRSAYPAVAALIDWWRYLTARQLRRRDVTAAFRAFLASPTLASELMDKATWRRWGLTRVVLRLNGEPVPVELPLRSGTSRLYVTGARADRHGCAWPDAVLSTLAARGPVEVLEGIQLLPIGCQDGLREVAVPGAVLDPAADPVVALVLLRRQAKRAGETRLAAAIRAITNSMVYGNPARFDPATDGVERPGPLCFPPLAATVAAGSRLSLALVDHDLDHRGSFAPYRDTDGSIIPVHHGGVHGKASA